MKNSKSRYPLGTALLALPIAVSFALAPVVSSQSYAPPEAVQAQAVVSQQELDQILAPIALYPDALLSQILMAATYPLEVVQAARWSQANPGLQGDQAVRAVAQRDWDPSVKSLVAFPQILSMMDLKLEWTQRLGDAFLAQEPQVMDTVQNLRQRAYAAGNLRSDDQLRVAPEGPMIVVESANPEFVYVPYYDPTVIYGRWWWPAPPVYWTPWQGYHAPRSGFYFSWGSGIPVARGFFFGAFDWPRRHTRVVTVNNYYYNRTVVINRQVDVHNNAVVRNANATPGIWRHDPTHRRGAQYRDPGVRSRFASGNTLTNTQAQPQARPTDNGRNAASESRVRAAEQKAEIGRSNGIRQEQRVENRNDERRKQETAKPIEQQNAASPEVIRQDNGRKESAAGNRVESKPEARGEIRKGNLGDDSARTERSRSPEARRETPPASNPKIEAPQPRVEQRQNAVRPASPPQPRTETVARPTPAPQPRAEMPRAPAPQARMEEGRSGTTSQSTPARRDQESRPASGGPAPRRGDGNETRRDGNK